MNSNDKGKNTGKKTTAAVVRLDKVQDKVERIRKDRKEEDLQKSFHKAMGWDRKKWPGVSLKKRKKGKKGKKR